VIAGDVPGHTPPDGPPAARLLTGEWRAALQPLRLVAQTPLLAVAPRGQRLVVDLPGWRTGPGTMAPLRRYLRLLGHDAHAWGQGSNVGDVAVTTARFVEELEARVQAAGRPASLVGWSLGGVVAREAARERPDLVELVVHLGTPVVGGPVHTAVARAWSPEQRARITTEVERRNRTAPLLVPVISILSRRDGVVDWRASVDTRTPGAVHHEVGSTHFGLGLDPDVWRLVARTLAGDRSRATGGR
jgi:pimeloyl-ACP methyl ester carboxylesterase